MRLKESPDSIGSGLGTLLIELKPNEPKKISSGLLGLADAISVRWSDDLVIDRERMTQNRSDRRNLGETYI